MSDKDQNPKTQDGSTNSDSSANSGGNSDGRPLSNPDPDLVHRAIESDTGKGENRSDKLEK